MRKLCIKKHQNICFKNGNFDKKKSIISLKNGIKIDKTSNISYWNALGSKEKCTFFILKSVTAWKRDKLERHRVLSETTDNYKTWANFPNRKMSKIFQTKKITLCKTKIG